MLKKFIWLSLSFLFIIFVASVVYFALGILTQPAAKQGVPVLGNAQTGFVVGSHTNVREEHEYICGDVQVVFQGRASKELIGLDMAALSKKYAEKDGWALDATGMNSLVLRRHVKDFCSEHRGYRHLGVYQGYLSIYQGPLGYDNKLIRVEESIPLSSLPSGQQVKLQQVMDYNGQAPETQAQLKAEFEFIDEASLNAVLENFDEMDEDQEPILRETDMTREQARVFCFHI